MEELIKELPDILLFLVTGFCCVRVFHFVALKEFIQESEHVLSISLVVGYIIVKLMNSIPWSISPEIDSIGITATGIIVGFLLGKMFVSGYMDKICDILNIQATTNKYIWNDLFDRDHPMEVIVEMNDGKIYKGFVHYIEPYNNTPNISIVGCELNANPKSSLNEIKTNRVILLNLQNAEHVEIVYSNMSSKVCDIKELTSNKSYI